MRISIFTAKSQGDAQFVKPTIMKYEKLKQTAGRLKRETYAIYLACRDPRVPWYARVLAGLVVAHTLSPIDLIPDFIPILGYLDDLIITPLGLYFAIKMIPQEVMAAARQQANTAELEGKLNPRAGIIIVLTFWAIGIAVLAFVIYRYLRP